MFWITLAAAAPYAEVLGIAQDAGHPQLGCEKDCCKTAGQGHHVSSLWVQHGEQGWLFDATPDITEQLGNRTLAGVFLTHAHIGHYTGLMMLGREAMGARKMPVWAMPRMRTFLTENGPWSQLVDLENIELQPAEAPVTQNGLTVIAHVVPHRDEFSETVAFEIRGPDKAVLYLPDVDKWTRMEPGVETLIGRVDVALLDGTFFDESELPGRDMSEIPHPFVVESLERFGPLSPGERAKIHFIHLNHTNPLLTPGSPEQRRVEEAGMNIASPGQRFPL